MRKRKDILRNNSKEIRKKIMIPHKNRSICEVCTRIKISLRRKYMNNIYNNSNNNNNIDFFGEK